jgi:hypothetical protein
MCSEEDVQVTKIGDFECADGNEIRMFDGNGDNAGTFDKKLDNCKRACLDRNLPLSSSWASFGSKMPGFIMALDGRCYCESSSSGNCEKDTEYGYSRWDFGTGVTRIGDFECADGNEIRMFDGNGDNAGTFDKKLDNCKRACLDKKVPLSSSWASFGSKMPGFIMNLDGRCYCESSSSGNCERENEYGYSRWDFGSACDCIGTPDWGNTCWPWQNDKDGIWCYLKGGLEARNCPGAILSSVAGAGTYWSEQPCAIKANKLQDTAGTFCGGAGIQLCMKFEQVYADAFKLFNEEGKCVSGFSDRIDYINYKSSKLAPEDNWLQQKDYSGIVYEGSWVEFVENIDTIKTTITEQKSKSKGQKSIFTTGWSEMHSTTVTASVSAAGEIFGASFSVSGTDQHTKSASNSQESSMSTTCTDTVATTTNCDTLFREEDMEGSSTYAFHIYRWHVNLKKLIPKGCADYYCTINKLKPNKCIEDVLNGKSGCCDVKNLLTFKIIGNMKTCMFKKFWMPRAGSGKPASLISHCSKLKPNCFPFADCNDDACQTCANTESRIEKIDAKTLHMSESCGDGHNPNETDQEEEEIAQLEELLGLLQELH